MLLGGMGPVDPLPNDAQVFRRALRALLRRGVHRHGTA
jgi:hypothetical protein